MPKHKPSLPRVSVFPLPSHVSLADACRVTSDELARSIKGFHQHALMRDGGSPGVRLPDALVTAASRPFTFVGSSFAFPNGLLQTATLLQSLVQGHIFVDANKRTAFTSCLYFLYECQYWPDEPVFHIEELASLEDLVLRLARQNEDREKGLIQQPYSVDDIAWGIHGVFGASQRRSIHSFRPGRFAKGPWRILADLFRLDG